MKDKDFDRLLNDSIKQYGHEYYHGADGPVDTGPAPVHYFRDDFLSDINVSEKPKKPVILKILPYLSAAAAVVIVVAAVTILPKILSGRSGISTTSPWNIASDLSPKESTAEGTSIVSQTSLPFSNNEAAHYDDEYNDTASRSVSYQNAYETEDTDRANHAVEPGKSASSVPSPSAGITVIPDSVSITVIFKEKELSLSGAELKALFNPVSEIMTSDYLSYVPDRLADTGDLGTISITSNGTDKVIIKNLPYDTLNISIGSSEIFITAVSDGKKERYSCGSSDINYSILTSLLDVYYSR